MTLRSTLVAGLAVTALVLGSVVSSAIVSMASPVSSPNQSASVSQGSTSAQANKRASASTTATFYNPVADVEDPSIVTDGGYYYLVGTNQNNQLYIQRSTTVGGLNSAAKTAVWSGPATGLGSARLWSPTLEYLSGKWYVYLSVTDSAGTVSHAAVYALESSTTSPLGPYNLKAAVKHWDVGVNPGPWEKGLVGPSVLAMPDGSLYLTSTTFGFYIQPMSNPWTLAASSSMTTINNGTPSLGWEGGTGEISRPIVHTVAGSTKVFVPYTSENHVTQRTNGAPCWSFCIGMFSYSTGSITNAASWTKSSQPVFAGGPSSGLFRILALNTFKSPDGTEDWMVYNGNDTAGTEFNQRYTFIQKMAWNTDGTPNFGTPTSIGTAITVPSGETGSPSPLTPGNTEITSDFASGTAGWTSMAGSWSACLSQYCSTSAGNNISTAGSTGLANYRITAKVRTDNAPSGSGVDVLARVKSVNDYYMFELLKDSAGVRKWVIAEDKNGSFSVLQSGVYNWSAGVEYTLRLDTNLAMLTGSISTDGASFAQLGSVRLTDTPGGDFPDFASGPAGLRTWGGLTAAFDDVSVVDLTPTMGFDSGPGWKGLTIDAGTAPGGAGDFCTQGVNDYCAGGHQLATSTTTDTSGVTDPLPASAYMNERWNDSAPATRINDGSFHYVIPSLEAGTKYRLRLHFAEIYYTAAGQRTFSVSINGASVLTNFDKVQAAGGANKAVIREFTAAASSTGQIDIAFSPGTTAGADHNPTISAIQVSPSVVVTPFSRTDQQVTDGTYTRIYNPDVAGVHWYINDHAFIKDASGTWHMFGITDTEPHHAGGEQTFAHATAPALTGPWTRQAPALTASPSYGETFLWAPSVLKSGNTYYMFYAGGGSDAANSAINVATSTDLFTWTRSPAGPLFRDGYLARDPQVVKIGTQWVMYYTATDDPAGGSASTNIVAYRTSTDLLNWSTRKTAFSDPAQGYITESPQLVAYGGSYYLFVGPRGPADAAGNPGASVYKSSDPFQFDRNQWVGHLKAHAPEVVQDSDGSWYVSHAGWGEQGLWLSPLSFTTPIAVTGYTATGPNYRAVVQTKPTTRLTELSIAMPGGGWRNLLDRDGVVSGPTMGVGSFGRTDVGLTAAASSLSPDGLTLTVTGIPMGGQPVTSDWVIKFDQRWFDSTLTWHVSGPTTAPIYEMGWSIDSAATPTIDDDVADNRDGDVPGFPQWIAATDTSTTLATAYRPSSAWSAANRWYAHGYASEGIVAWQSIWAPGGTTLPTGTYAGGRWRVGGTAVATDKPFAQMLRAGVSF